MPGDGLHARGELTPDAALPALLPDPDLPVDILVLEHSDRLGRAQRAAAKRLLAM